MNYLEDAFREFKTPLEFNHHTEFNVGPNVGSIDESIYDQSLETRPRPFLRTSTSPKVDATAQSTLRKLKEKAHAGDLEAYRKIGCKYMLGDGVKQSEGKAFKYYKIAADKKSPQAQYEVAYLYEQGIGTEHSFKDALNYFKKAQVNGLKAASEKLKEIFSDLTKKIRSKSDDYSDNLYKIGLYYLIASNTTTSKVKALKYFQDSAAEGHCAAAHEAANMFRDGIGTQPSIQKAYKLYDQIIMRGQNRADAAILDRDKMIKNYHKNYDTLRSEHSAKALIKQAKIHQQIAGSYASSAAMELYEKAIEIDPDPEAQFELANIYATHSASWIQNKAINLYIAAADSGHKRAKLILKVKGY